MILVAIGSNLSSEAFGSPLNNCKKAIELLEKKFKLLRVSNFYETEPIPKSDQPMYINGVISLRTKNLPNEILDILMSVEIEFQRVRKFKNESRVIDLDLLCYNNLVLNTKNLILPHPRMHLRRFVIQPICDIDENWKHPILKISAKNLLKTLVNQNISIINTQYG
jgi:2-amino-4-hydroxy-6-hydroxymethyldihydropteridine diphosphokinase